MKEWTVLRGVGCAQRWQRLNIIQGKVGKYSGETLASFCWHWGNKCHTLLPNIPQENPWVHEVLRNSRWVGRSIELTHEGTLSHEKTEGRNQNGREVLHSSLNKEPRGLQMGPVLSSIVSRLFFASLKIPHLLHNLGGSLRACLAVKQNPLKGAVFYLRQSLEVTNWFSNKTER